MLEAEMTTDTGFAADRTVDLGHQAALICTECGGPLWEMHAEPPVRYRCRLGHAFTARTLQAGQAKDLEHALLAALRVMGDQVSVLNRLKRDAEARRFNKSVQAYEQRSTELNAYMAQRRELLLDAKRYDSGAESSSPS